MKISYLVVVAILICPATSAFAQIEKMPESVQVVIRKNFRSWQVSDVDNVIVEYFKKDRPHEHPNAIKGDWNGDGKTDYAFQLQNRNNKEAKILVALIRSGAGFKSYVLGKADDCLMSEKKGRKGFDFERQRSFRYQNDAIFSYIWEKAGTSYFWRNGRFRGILTSD